MFVQLRFDILLFVSQITYFKFNKSVIAENFKLNSLGDVCILFEAFTIF